MVKRQINQGKNYTIPCENSVKKSTNSRKNYFHAYYLLHRSKYLQANRLRRAKLKLFNPLKPRSPFSLHRQQNFLRCLNKHHIIVPILRFLKTKYPTIKGWNLPNWWCPQTIFQLLAQGYNYFTLLNKDNSYRGVRIGCIDIDQSGWTKLPTKYWTCYITPNNGKIKLLFLYKDNENLKTGKGYFNGQAILDFKVSGGIMGIGSFHPNGQPYQVKGAGSLFLKGNHVFNNPYEVMHLLQQDWGIQYKTIGEHFLLNKNQHQILSKDNSNQNPAELQFKKTLFVPTKGPPKTRWKERNNLSKAVN